MKEHVWCPIFVNDGSINLVFYLCKLWKYIAGIYKLWKYISFVQSLETVNTYFWFPISLNYGRAYVVYYLL